MSTVDEEEEDHLSFLSKKQGRKKSAFVRGFLHISSLVWSVSPVRPVEARWQLQLIAQKRLAREKVGERGEAETEGRMRGSVALESEEELCDCPTQYPPAYFQTRAHPRQKQMK